MADAVGIARLVLVAVFAVAGWAKLSDRPGTRQAVLEFGVPQALARPVAFLLPLAELVAAGLLLFSGSAVLGAVGAAVLLGLFIVAIAVSLARGRRPDCHCFGQVHSEPVGAKTLVRNVVLVGVAVFVAAEGHGTNAWNFFDNLTAAAWVGLAAGVVVAAALGILAWLVVNLIAQQGRLLNRIDTLETALGIESQPDAAPAMGLPVGSDAPAFELESTTGETVSLDSLLTEGNAVMLVFTTADCGPCNALMPELAGWQDTFADSITFAVVGGGNEAGNRAKASEHGIRRLLLQENDEVATTYAYVGTPSAVAISAQGKIISSLVAGVDGIRGLVRQAADGNLPPQRWVPVPLNGGQGHAHDHEPQGPPPGPPVGEPAPPISLPDLEGRTVSLAGLRGQPTMVLFWNPGCGFCAGMLDELREWDHSRTNGAPQLLVVSSGTAESHAEMQLQSPVVLDDASATMSAYSAHGTPMAVLVDDDGNVASNLAVGAVEVMSLARSGATVDSAS
jgi:peroxiredoxin